MRLRVPIQVLLLGLLVTVAAWVVFAATLRMKNGAGASL